MSSTTLTPTLSLCVALRRKMSRAPGTVEYRLYVHVYTHVHIYCCFLAHVLYVYTNGVCFSSGQCIPPIHLAKGTPLSIRKKLERFVIANQAFWSYWSMYAGDFSLLLY